MTAENVCAIILDYRGANKTGKCLLSLMGQGLRTAYVLDNSGSESSSAELSKTIERVRLADPGFRIEILSAGKNLGFGCGVNFVLSCDRHSTSPHDYYLLLNNDAIAGPALVSGLLSALKKDPQAALVAPRIVSSDPAREYGIWYHRYLGLLLSRPGRLRFHYFTGCCLLLPRHLVGATGLFDEAFFMYGEDTELGWRLTRQGKKMICATDVFVEHEYGLSVDRSSLFYEYHMTRGHILLNRLTYLHPIEIPFLMVTKSITLSLRAVIRSFRNQTVSPVAAWFLAWLPRKWILRQFRQLSDS
jgi:N-acetylglucosaminyl-diphospho-decaprenol L-rhamnosyltransferase